MAPPTERTSSLCSRTSSQRQQSSHRPPKGRKRKPTSFSISQLCRLSRMISMDVACSNLGCRYALSTHRRNKLPAYWIPRHISSQNICPPPLTAEGTKKAGNSQFPPCVSRSKPVGQRRLGVGAALLVDTSVALPRTSTAHFAPYRTYKSRI